MCYTWGMSDSQSVKPLGDGGLSAQKEAILIRRAAIARWKVPESVRNEMAARLWAMMDSEDERVRVNAARTLATLEAQNQADDHLADKNARLDAGKSTENVEVRSPIRYIGVDEKDL